MAAPLERHRVLCLYFGAVCVSKCICMCGCECTEHKQNSADEMGPIMNSLVSFANRLGVYSEAWQDTEEFQECCNWGASQVVQVVKNPPACAGDVRDGGLISGSGRSSGGGHGNSLQQSCLENTQGQGSLVGYSPSSHKESDMTEVTQHTCSTLELDLTFRKMLLTTAKVSGYRRHKQK